MQKKLYRIFTYLLCFMLFIIATSAIGCSKKTDTAKQDQKKTSAKRKADVVATVSYHVDSLVLNQDGMFVKTNDQTEDASIQKEDAKYQRLKCFSSTCYLLSDSSKEGAITVLGEDLSQSGHIIFKKKKERQVEDFYVYKDGSFSVLSNKMKGQGQDMTVSYYYDQYGEDGKKLSYMELGEYAVSISCILVKEGYLLMEDRRTSLYGQDGKKRWEKNIGLTKPIAAEQGEDGFLYLLVSGSNYVPVLVQVDIETGETLQEFETGTAFGGQTGICGGSTEKELYLYDTEKGLYSYNLEGKKQAGLLADWLKAGIQINQCGGVCPWQEGSWLCLLDGMLCHVSRGKDVEKTILTFAMRGPCQNEMLTSQIRDFNQKHTDVQIDILDYADYEDPVTQLQLDIASGSCPDILDAYFLADIDGLAEKGVLQDLYPFMESDPDVKPELFVEQILDLLEQDGKLYYIPTDLILNYLVCRREIIPETDGAAKAELDLLTGLLETDPEKRLVNVNSSTFLDRILLAGRIERFFESEATEKELTALLQMIKKMEELGYDSDLEQNTLYDLAEKKDLFFWIKDGGQIFKNEVVENRAAFGKGNYVFCGYPCTKGSGICLSVEYANRLCITTACKDPDAAWEFVRVWLTEKMQDGSRYIFHVPLRKKALEKRLKEEFNKKDRKMYRKLVKSADYMWTGVDLLQLELQEIIREESSAYFSGDKTLEQAMDVMQSRVKLCISERE